MGGLDEGYIILYIIYLQCLVFLVRVKIIDLALKGDLRQNGLKQLGSSGGNPNFDHKLHTIEITSMDIKQNMMIFESVCDRKKISSRSIAMPGLPFALEGHP